MLNLLKMSYKSTAETCPTCALLAIELEEPQHGRAPHVEELLRRNEPIKDEELVAFRLIVDKSPDIIDGLNERIDQVEELLEVLLQTRIRAKADLADARSLIHPMRALPNTLMTTIFSYCVPTWATALSEGEVTSLDPALAPWTLSFVCRRWRDIVLSSPELWTYLELDIDDHQVHITPRQLAYKMTLFIERSKGLPLFFHLSSTHEIANHPIFPALEVSLPRWKHLSVDLPRSTLRCLSGNVFSSLEQLVILDIEEESDERDSLYVFDTKNAPNLCVLEVDEQVPWQAFEYFELPWTRLLQVVDFPAVDFDAFWHLQKMSSLEDLAVIMDEGEMPMRAVKASLPKLARLSIQEELEAHTKSSKAFCAALDIPALSELRFTFPSARGRVHHFPNFRAADRFTKLHITCAMSCNSNNSGNILHFLSHAPFIEDFTIVDSGMSVKCISGLKVTSTSTRLPRLRILDFSGCFCDDVLSEDWATIYDMLESRRAEPADPNSKTTGNALVLSNHPGTSAGALYLEKLCVPRWLYCANDVRWEEICKTMKVECGVTMRDDFSAEEEFAHGSDYGSDGSNGTDSTGTY
ncbi:hypothetical protein CPB85DRAFT_1563413 [Mucidula mucida]|nr:hypothetical protein CPB85DRAFT_1563413 [Mucidula mucida]